MPGTPFTKFTDVRFWNTLSCVSICYW